MKEQTMNLGDVRFTKDVLVVDLWYPNLEPDPGAEPRTPDHPVAVEVGLMHVRAADSILIEYDFDRDGYVIKQASIFQWESGDTAHDRDWQEVAFVEAWGRERDSDENADADADEVRPTAEAERLEEEEARRHFATMVMPIDGRGVGPFTYYLAGYRARGPGKDGPERVVKSEP